MKIITKLLSITLAAFILFIVWMNLTPGYFQGTCTCKVQYLTDKRAEQRRLGICSLVGLCVEDPVTKFANRLFYKLAALDFHR